MNQFILEFMKNAEIERNYYEQPNPFIRLRMGSWLKYPPPSLR